MTVLFVVGMHRSGTSALCAALHACGVTFGTKLLDPMAGVNDEGFWEDADVVQLNENLLSTLGYTWYTVPEGGCDVDWDAESLKSCKLLAIAILQRGFGDGDLQAVKDPRLCITLPFWLHCCAALNIATKVCVISRAAIEVAQSLEKRDGFPVGYSMHLCLAYQQCLVSNLTSDTIQLSYSQLLDTPLSLMQDLAHKLPLTINADALNQAVRSDLRHQLGDTGEELVSLQENLLSLTQQVADEYPATQVLPQLATALVARGQALINLGEEHSKTLATLDTRDADVDALAREHRTALATIEERDQQILGLDKRLSDTGAHLKESLRIISERDDQIVEFDHRLQASGDLHTHALEVIAEKDRILEEASSFIGSLEERKAFLEERHARLASIPILGLLIRLAVRYDKG